MSEASRQGRGLPLLGRAAATFRVRDWRPTEIDASGFRYVATISVRLHWLVYLLLLIELLHRPSYGPGVFGSYVVLVLVLVGFNGYVHYRLRTNRLMNWPWIMAYSAVDIAVVSIAVGLGGGFSHYFFHLFYYPALAAFAIVFTSFGLNMLWATAAALIYVGVSLMAGDGLDLGARDEKPLLARVAIMYVIAAAVSLVSRFEGARWRGAVERERTLQRERAEFSQTVHDTTAQAAYMIGLGIDTAKAQAGDSNPELAATLEATSELSRSMIWELRHPIGMGGIYEGRELSRALRSHAVSFATITSVPAEMTSQGQEPHLSTEVRGLLFSIAHNALTNAYRHAEASRVAVHLEFGEEEIRLSVSDDGVGLPDDYAERGHGFAGMSRNAERLGGRLLVEKRGHLGGATVTCVLPA